MSRQCQLCGGPVVNGRCTLCGMPYRSDEILYHFNENRRDHYEHASRRARKIMKNQEIPAADRKNDRLSGKSSGGSGKDPAGSRSSAAGRSDARPGAQAVKSGVEKMPGSGQTMKSGPERMPGSSQAVNSGAERMPESGQNVKAGSAGGGERKGNRDAGTRTAASRERNVWLEKERKKSGKPWNEKKKRGVTKLSVLIIVLVVLLLTVPSAAARFFYRYHTENDDRNYYRRMMEEGEYVGYLSPEQQLLVGEEIRAGQYLLYAAEGTAHVRIDERISAFGDYSFENFTLDGNDPWRLMDLRAGQMVSFSSENRQEGRLEFYFVPENS